MAQRRTPDTATWSVRVEHDHTVIRRVLSAIDDMLVVRPQLPLDFATAAVEFLGRFVGCHEQGEHEVLFPLLREWIGDPAAPALATLEVEHAEERHRLAAIASTLRAPDADRSGPLALYGAFLRGHLTHERQLLEAFAAVPMPADLEARVRDAFVAVDHGALGPDGATAMHGLADALERAARSAGTGRSPDRVRVARDLMRTRTGAVSPDASLTHAIAELTALGVRELPVVCAGTLVGILTVRDLEPHRGRLEWTPVRAAMTPNPTTVGPDASAPEVARVLRDGGFNACPVVVDGVLRGMIGRRELLLVIADDECQ